MKVVNRTFYAWLAPVSVIVLVFVTGTYFFPPPPAEVGAFFLAAAPAGLFLLWRGVYLLARPEVVGNAAVPRGLGKLRPASAFLRHFLSRPANIVTALRLPLVLAGIALSISGVPSGSLLIAAGFLLDALDGALARRESPAASGTSYAARLGPGFDAESDALALLLAGWALVALGQASALLLIPAAARYGFGLLFALVPTAPAFPVWYRRYSKIAAALFQVWIALAWLAYAYGLPAKLGALLHGPALTLVSVLITLSFLLETAARLRLALVGLGHDS